MKARLTPKKPCKHPESEQRIKVLEAIVNCETTIKICGLCGKQLSKPKIDCR